MTKIRRQVSNLLGILIQEDEWDDVFNDLNKENRLNSKNINKLLLIIFKRLEEMEDEQE